MSNQASHASAEAAVDERESTPSLRFRDVSVAVCVLLEHADEPVVAPSRNPPLDNAFTYHQYEFVSYAYRDNPPFRLEPKPPTVVLETLDDLKCAFPEIVYTTAGAPRRLRGTTATRPVTVDVARVLFAPSRLSILVILLGLGDSEEAEGSAAGGLSEFDVIRLIKLWEGGEATPHLVIAEDSHSLALSGDPWVRFDRTHGASLTFAELIDEVRRQRYPNARYIKRPASPSGESGSGDARPYVTGAVQLLCNEPTMTRLVTGFRRLHGRRSPAAALQDALTTLASGCGVTPPWSQRPDPLLDLVPLSGILRGLMAFDDTYPHELRSIFRETTLADRLITAVHKGTFLRVGEEMRVPSAYFILPHCIALHNEALLDRAVKAGADRLTATVRPEKRFRVPTWRALDAARRAVNNELDQRLDAAVIHYPNLRELYERAARARGLIGLATRADSYADELRVEANTARASVQAWAEVVVTVLAVIVAIIVGVLQLAGTGGSNSARSQAVVPAPSISHVVRTSTTANRARSYHGPASP
jgi:hypothetical protein